METLIDKFIAQEKASLEEVLKSSNSKAEDIGHNLITFWHAQKELAKLQAYCQELTAATNDAYEKEK